MPKISRRTFLRGSVAAIAAATFGTYLVWRRNSPEAFVKQAVKRNLTDYDTDEAELNRFAADFLKQEHSLMQQSSVQLAVRMRQVFFSDLARKFAPRQQRFEIEWLERKIMTRFVQSTDLLYSAPDSRRITYVRYWDPYSLGCGNPMARYDFD